MGCGVYVLHEAVASSISICATMSRSQGVATGVCPFVGMISTKCSASEVVTDAVNDARSICMREYATAPEVNIYGDPNFTFAYVPSHLHHMTFELVKNSLRAVNDKFDDSDEEPPPVRLVIAEGEEDITVKVPTCSCSSTNQFLTMMSCRAAVHCCAVCMACYPKLLLLSLRKAATLHHDDPGRLIFFCTPPLSVLMLHAACMPICHPELICLAYDL